VEALPEYRDVFKSLHGAILKHSEEAKQKRKKH